MAGNIVNDGLNNYVYDAEGRLCAVGNSVQNKYQYVYDAEGRRVAKGSITGLPAQGNACAAPVAANGFTPTNIYLRGELGNQDTEITGTGVWAHTNIFANGGLTATAVNAGLPSGWNPQLVYDYSNWVGTKRVELNSVAQVDNYWRSDPYGDYLTTPTTLGATEQMYTGKERDAESGLDYFGARYYGSSMGRFMSPDWADVNDGPPDAVAFGDLGNPQSLNLYGYVQSNPLSNVDSDGHDCINASNASSGSVSVITTSNPADCGKGFTYVDGTINASSLTYNTTTRTLSFDTSNYADGSGTAGTNVFAKADPYGPLEGPANMAGASLIGNTAGGVVNGVAGFELSIIFPWETLAAQLSSHIGPNGTQAAGISRKPGTLGMRKGTDALRRENKIARDVTKALGLNEKEAEAVHGLIQEGSQTFQRPMTFTEALEYVGEVLGKMPK